MSNSTVINIIKRNGKSEPLDVNKIHKVVEFACEGLTGVSASQVEMSSHIQFYDGMTSKEIQDIMVKSANDLITLENPNYQYVAARLLLYATYKDVYGEFNNKTLHQMIELNIERGVYDPEILEKYDADELTTLDKYIKRNRDENFTYAGLRQVVDKYLCQDRSTGHLFEDRKSVV